MMTRAWSVAVALWLMFLPAVLDEGHSMTVSVRVVAPIALSAAIVALGPTTRGVRLLHIPLAVLLAVSGIVLPASSVARMAVVLTAAALGAAALPGGRVNDRHGDGWATVIGELRASLGAGRRR